MSKGLLDIRLYISENQEDDHDVVEKYEKIKEVMKINSKTEIMKACIRVAWDTRYRDLYQNQK